MSLNLRWTEYDANLFPTFHRHVIETESQILELLQLIKENAKAEEVLLTPRNKSLSERDFRFRYSDDRTQAYATYGQSDYGYFESVGDLQSPEQFTSDGGSYSAGTAIPVAILEQAVVEFLHTNEIPAAVVWIEEEETVIEHTRPAEESF